MLIQLWQNSLAVSITTGVFLLLAFFLSRLLANYHWHQAYRWLWLLVAIRLLLPIQFTLAEPVILPEAVWSPKIHQTATTQPDDTAISQPNTANPQITPGNATAAQTTKGLSTIISWPKLLAGLWLAGILFLILKQSWQNLHWQKQCRRWRRPVPPHIQFIYQEVCQEMQQKPLPIYCCPWVSCPLYTGLLHPLILLPDYLCQENNHWTKEQLADILRHELTHHRSHDLWYQLILRCAVVLHWYNPLVWLLQKQAKQQLELCCDEKTIRQATPEAQLHYAQTILQAMQLQKEQKNRPNPIFSTAFHHPKTFVQRRFASMFSKTSQKKKWFLLCLLCLCFLGCNVLLGCNTAPTDQQEVALADIWAKAWQTRDGKPRYEIMNQEMQQQFKQQQKEMSGSEDTWNIRWSSPWPENYFIDIETKDGEKTALITYTYTDSAGDKYEGKERLFFAQENGNLVVAAADMEVEMETLVLDFPAKIKAIQYYRQGQKQTIDLQSDLGKRLIHEYYRMLGQIQGFSALAEAENQDDATKTKEGTALEFLFAEPVSLASFTNLGNEMPDDLSATLTSLAADNKTTLLQSGGQYGQYTIFTEKHYIKTLAELVAKQTTSF